MSPTLGDRVHYRLSEQDAVLINKRRDDSFIEGQARNHGNTARSGDVYPALVVRVFPGGTEVNGVCNLQVQLDGNDTYWATSRTRGDQPGQWTLPEEAVLPLLGELELASGRPTLGQMVGYRGKLGLQAPRAAVVTGTVDSLDPRGVETGQVPALDSDRHVHLWVFTPGESGGFAEFNIGPGFEPGEWSALWTAPTAETAAFDLVHGAPVVGDRVHYVSYGTPGGEYTSQCRAAIVTEITDGQMPMPVSLCVLNPDGMYFNKGVAFDEGEETAGDPECPNRQAHGNPFRYCACGWMEATRKGGTWHWPERV